MERRARVLVVDGSQQNLRFIQALLNVAGYEVIIASSGEEALAEAEKVAPDLILLEAMRPKLNGFEICARLKRGEETRLIPVVLIAPSNELAYKLKGFAAGMDDFLHRPINRAEFLAMVRSLVEAKQLNDELVSVEDTILALANAIEAKDPYTEGHVERVASYAVGLGREIGLSPEELRLLRRGAILHDVGKIGIDEAVLLKPGPLSEEEFAQVKAHPIVGARICEPLKQDRLILQVVRHHHERYDGKGYPEGLTGEAIPIAARIMAVVDAYDALTSERPYRPRLMAEEALKVLRNEMGKQFDPRLALAFINMVETGRLC